MRRNRLHWPVATCFLFLAAHSPGYGQFALPTPGQSPAAPAKPAPAAVPGSPASPATNKADEPKKEDRTPAQLDLKSFGRPEGKELNVSARYYLWHDGDGWHLRSCCKDGYVSTFQGEIALTGGTFEKFRTIELETKGKHPDAWQVSEDRTKLKFIIKSSDHPDGFDFTVKGRDATVAFDLKVAGKDQPKRIFIGHDNLHPPKAYFAFPADHR